MSETTEIPLVFEFKESPDEFWPFFAQKYNQWILGVALSRFKGYEPGKATELAEEVRQEVHIQLRRSIHNFKTDNYSPGGFRRWLFGMIANLASKQEMKIKNQGTGNSDILNILSQQPSRGELNEEEGLWQKQVCAEVVRRIKAEVNSLHWKVYEQLLHGIPTETIAQGSGFRISNIYKIRSRINALLRDIKAQVEEDWSKT